MSSDRATTDRQQAAEWLQHGQALEAQNTAESVGQAITCYERAAALLRSLADATYDFAIARMNFGHALAKLGRLDESVSAYDEAIARLQPLANRNADTRNSLGAAWMNRGHALLRLNTPEARAAALLSQDAAIAIFETLPHAEHLPFRFNLAGAWLNRTQALLASSADAPPEALTGAATALGLVAPVERTEVPGASIGLMARHAQCLALARSAQAASDSQPIPAISDTIDSAMELVRHWEQRHPGAFRPLARALYHFGAQFYLSHQPQFLGEFLLEALDPENGPGSIPDDPELHAIAGQALARARADHYNRRLAAPVGQQSGRLQEIAESLAAADARCIALRQAAPFAKAPDPALSP